MRKVTGVDKFDFLFLSLPDDCWSWNGTYVARYAVVRLRRKNNLELDHMTEMDLKRIHEELHRLTVLTEGWNAQRGIATLERDLALAKLRELYDIVRFAPNEAAGNPAEVSAEAEMPLSISLDEVLRAAIIPADEDRPQMQDEFLPEEEQIEAEPEAEPEPEFEPENEPEPEPEFEPESESRIELEEVFEVIPEIGSEPESPVAQPEAAKPAAEAVSVKSLDPVLFGLDELEQHKRKQRVIMSLYGDAPATKQPELSVEQPTVSVRESAVKPMAMAEPEPADVPPAKPQPVFVAELQPESKPDSEEDPDSEIEIISVKSATSEMGAVLGDTINRGVQTLGETFVAPRNTISEAAHLAHVDDLRSAIGINDRFLLVRDLFGGDAAACDAAIEKLNAFDDLDDCMIYIAEHYAWNPNSDGAKLLVELLERKLI